MNERSSDSSADNNNEESNRSVAADAASVSDCTESASTAHPDCTDCASTSHPDSESISLEIAQDDDAEVDGPCPFCPCSLRYRPKNLSNMEIAEKLAKSRARSPESEPSVMDTLAGMSAILDTAWDTIKLPLDCPDNGRRPSRGMILHGENGVGKSMIETAIKERCSLNNPKISVFDNKFFDGAPDKLVRLFDMAQEQRPSIIFLDWFNSVGGRGGSNVETLGTLMDGLDYCGSVFVFAISDNLDRVDPALRKCGRFDTEIFIELPDLETRKDILRKLTRTWNLPQHVINQVANGTSGYTGADLDGLRSRAYWKAVDRVNSMRNAVGDDAEIQPEDRPKRGVEMEDFKEVMRTFRSTLEQRQSMKRHKMLDAMSGRCSDNGTEADNIKDGNSSTVADAASTSSISQCASTTQPGSDASNLKVAKVHNPGEDGLCQCSHKCSLRPSTPIDEEVAMHFAKLKRSTPSNILPSVTDSIGGMKEVMCDVWFHINFNFHKINFREMFSDIPPSRGLILHGPSGVGKSMLIQSLIEGCNRRDSPISTFENKNIVGDVEDSLAELFDAARRLRPSIIFMDSFDAIAHTGNRNVHALRDLLDELDEWEPVLLVAATNRLQAIDPKLRRYHGYFDDEIRIELPDLEARKDILHRMTLTWNVRPPVINLAANGTSGFSGADLSVLCRTAWDSAVERTNSMKNGDNQDASLLPVGCSTIRVEMEDFKEALRTVRPAN